MLELVVVLLIIGAVCFGLDGIKVAHPAISWTPLAWMFVLIAAVVWLYETTDVLR